MSMDLGDSNAVSISQWIHLPGHAREASAAQRFVQVAFREIGKSRRRRIESNELPGGRFSGDAVGADVFNDGPQEERGRGVAI
jgi:hypothetical protein